MKTNEEVKIILAFSTIRKVTELLSQQEWHLSMKKAVTITIKSFTYLYLLVCM